MNKIVYKPGYRYQLKQDYNIQLDFFPLAEIKTPFIEFGLNGVLTLKNGYAWDGPSGPVIHTRSFMRGSLVHDGLYQLMRESHLNHINYRELADKALLKICLEDGLCKLTAITAYWTVRLFGDHFADPGNNHAVKTAP